MIYKYGTKEEINSQWKMSLSSLRNVAKKCFPCTCKNETVPGEEDDSQSSPNSLLKCVARVFSKRPFVVLFLTLTFAALLTRFGISEFGFPEFEDPYLVRFIFLSNMHSLTDSQTQEQKSFTAKIPPGKNEQYNNSCTNLNFHAIRIWYFVY